MHGTIVEIAVTLAVVAAVCSVPAVVWLHMDARRYWHATLALGDKANGRRDVARSFMRSSRFRLVQAAVGGLFAFLLLVRLIQIYDTLDGLSGWAALLVGVASLLVVLPAVDGWQSARDRRRILANYLTADHDHDDGLEV